MRISMGNPIGNERTGDTTKLVLMIDPRQFVTCLCLHSACEVVAVHLKHIAQLLLPPAQGELGGRKGGRKERGEESVKRVEVVASRRGT